jgi:hypothetical protein
MDLAITGPLSAANVKGTATLVALSLGGTPDIGPLWTAQRIELPRIFGFPTAPWSNWQFDLACKANSHVKLSENPGMISGSITVTGPGSAPTITGTVNLSNVAAACDGPWSNPFEGHAITGKRASLTVSHATIDFLPTRPLDPTIDIEVTSSVRLMPFWDTVCSATVTGPLSRLMRTYDGPPPLTDDAVREAFAGRPWAMGDAFSLEVYPPIAIEAGFGPVPLN